MSHSSEQAVPKPWQDRVARVLFSEADIQRRVAEIGVEISALLDGQPIHVVGLMKGSMFFLADLLRRLQTDCEVSFLTCSSYGKATQSGPLTVSGLDDLDIHGQTVLVVDDILDTGKTLSRVMADLRTCGPERILSCVLLDKRGRREKEVKPDFAGFSILNDFVIGYGMDFDGRYRNLPFVGVLKEG